MAPNKFIVVFKKTASTDAINSQADGVNANGGKVTKRFDSIVMKGFAAEITDTYLLALQSNLQQADSQISYIEPDSEVTTQ